MSNVRFAKYDPMDGRILFVGEVPEPMVDLQGDNVWVGPADPLRHYLDLTAGALVDRPTMATTIPAEAVADGTTVVTLVGVPAGAHVRVVGPNSMDGTTEAATDVFLTFALPGEYTVSVVCFPFIDVVGVIHAT